MIRTRLDSTRLQQTGMLLLALLLILVASPALAEEQGQQPTMRARSAQTLPGDTITVTGKGFKPDRKLTLIAEGEPLESQSLVTDDKGTVQGQVTIPADAQTGLLHVNVKTNDQQVTELAFMVSKQLPLSGKSQFEIARNQLPAGLYQVAFSASNNAVYVTRALRSGESGILKISPETLKVGASTASSQESENGDAQSVYAVFGLAVDSDHETLWATNSSKGTVAVYRQDDLSLVKQFRPGAAEKARSVLVAPKVDKAYVTTVSSGYVAVFDTNTLQHLTNIKIDLEAPNTRFMPMGLALDPDTGTVYTSSLTASAVAVIDTASDKVERILTLEQARSLRDLGWDAANNHLLAADYGSDSLLVVDPQSGKIIHDTYVGASPLAVTWDPASGLAYVANWGAGTVAVVDPATGERVANLPIGPSAVHIVGDGNGHIYVVNKADDKDNPKGNRITRISPTKME